MQSQNYGYEWQEIAEEGSQDNDEQCTQSLVVGSCWLIALLSNLVASMNALSVIT